NTRSVLSSTTFAVLPLKSKRCRTSLIVWLRAFDTTALSTCETISNEFCWAIRLRQSATVRLRITPKPQHVKVISTTESIRETAGQSCAMLPPPEPQVTSDVRRPGTWLPPQHTLVRCVCRDTGSARGTDNRFQSKGDREARDEPFVSNLQLS